MPETLLPATIRARVHEDAISRVTRFFNATTIETLNELFQNARRAGATRVDVTIADGEVRVADDGHGIAQPAALLAFGQSRWDADTARREDPAGMGVYALARRPKVTVRSRPRPAGGRQLPAWQVELTPKHFLGEEHATVSIIDGETLPFGTEVIFDDDKANTGSVDVAAEHFPLPVTCNNSNVDRRDFLHDAIHVEVWRGIRLGVLSGRYYPARRPELNFHGIRIEDVRLPVIYSMDSHCHVKTDVVDCAELELVLPARKEIVETPFVEQLRTACRTAIYRAMLNVDSHVDVPADVRADALAHGVQLPVARPELPPWRPQYRNEYSTKQEKQYRTALPEKPIIIEAEMPPCDQVALWRAARRSDISHRLCAEEPRYRGYPWYDKLTRARKMTTRVVLDGEEITIEEQRTRHEPPHTARTERITFVLETVDGDGTIQHVCIPSDVAFGDDEASLAGRHRRARHQGERHHAGRSGGADVRRVLLPVRRLRGRQLRDPAGRLPPGGRVRGAGAAGLGRGGDALERAHGRPPLDPAAPAAGSRHDDPYPQGQAHRDHDRVNRRRERRRLSETATSRRCANVASTPGRHDRNTSKPQGDERMHWNKLRLIITNEDGEVFAEHELGPVAASQLQEIADQAADGSRESDEDVVHDLLADIETAADNVRRGAVTDDNNLIVSEAGC